MRTRPHLGVKHPWLLLLGKRYIAITRPPFGIYFSSHWWREASVGARLRTMRHEMAHWRQYQAMGFWKFHWRWITLYFKHGYRNHPMEIEAREAQ